LFWGFMALSGFVVRHHDFFEFSGLRQLYQRADEVGRPTGMPRLVDTGIYGVIRHPMYFFTLAAMLVCPLMTLDLAIVFAASALYLAVGIPIEERKLVTTFGEPYLQYRSRVPALIPKFK